jgi:hypothetical protein
VLTRPAQPAVGRHSRAAALVACVRPTVGVTPTVAAAVTVVLACAPAAVALAAGASDVEVAVVLAFVLGGAVLGWATDDPAADVLAAMPVPAPVRAAVRGVAVMALAAVGLAVVTVWVVAGNRSTLAEVTDRLPEAAAAGTVALAMGLFAARRGDRAAGATGVVAGVLVPVTVAALAVRWPGALPAFGSGPAHVRWWLVVALAGVVAARAGRDPGRR